MVETVDSILQELGLSKNETLVYLTLVKRGQSTAYRISKDAKLYKANTYQAVDTLIRKNLITKLVVNNRQLIKAVPPEEFLGMIDRQKEKMQALLPMISRNFDDESEIISVFSGVDMFMNMLYHLLDLNKPIYVFDIPSYAPEMLKYYLPKFHAERIRRKVKMYHLYDYDAKDRINTIGKMHYTYARQGKAKRFSLVSTLTCGDITLIINWKKNIKVIQVKDNDVAETYKHQFDILWE
jgi:sugar-specific transcriptional regulator TrmB